MRVYWCRRVRESGVRRRRVVVSAWREWDIWLRRVVREVAREGIDRCRNEELV